MAVEHSVRLDVAPLGVGVMGNPNNRDDHEDDTEDALTYEQREARGDFDDVYDDDFEGGCWYCGSRRHFAQSCPKPDLDRNPSMYVGLRLGR